MRDFLENKNMTLISQIQQKCQDLNTCHCPGTQNAKGKHKIQVKDIEDQSKMFNDLISKITERENGVIGEQKNYQRNNA